MKKTERWFRRKLDDLWYWKYFDIEISSGFCRWLDTNRLATGMCENCCDFFNRYHVAYSKVFGFPTFIHDEWFEMFDDLAYMMRISKVDKQRILCREEWVNPENQQESLGEMWSDFVYDVFYCSDRWNPHRLTRCHDKYLIFCDALKKQRAINKIEKSKKEN